MFKCACVCCFGPYWLSHGVVVNTTQYSSLMPMLNLCVMFDCLSLYLRLAILIVRLTWFTKLWCKTIVKLLVTYSSIDFPFALIIIIDCRFNLARCVHAHCSLSVDYLWNTSSLWCNKTYLLTPFWCTSCSLNPSNNHCLIMADCGRHLHVIQRVNYPTMPAYGSALWLTYWFTPNSTISPTFQIYY